MSVGSQTSSVCILLLLSMLQCAHPTRKYIPSYIGPFLTIINRVEDCSPPGSSRVNVKFSHYNPQRPYDKQWGWGDYTLGIPIDDEKSHISLVLDRWSNNQWKENFYIIRFTKNACTMCLENMSVCRALFQQAAGKIGKGVKCSVPVGTYQLPNQTWDFSFANIRTLAYGRFRVNIKSGHLDHPNVINCMAVTVDLIPKP